ncbi:MAG: type III pantothenate kinase [Methylobacter sp.]
MNLLIDIGNSRLKWAATTAGQIIPGQPLLNESVTRDELIRLWGGKIRPRRIAVSCVGARRLLELVQSVARELWLDIDIVVVKSQAQSFGVINAYRQPEKLGVDRWLALVAAWQQFRGPACIVDCGTAITVDLIDAGGRHLGGLISPGLTLMKESLGQRTEALPRAVAQHDIGLADHTEAAIYSGTLMAAVGLIKHVLAQQPHSVQLVLTGGDAESIAPQLGIVSTVIPDLVLRGLLCVLEGHA